MIWFWSSVSIAVASMGAYCQTPCSSSHAGALYPSDAGSGGSVGARVAVSASGEKVVVTMPGHTHGGVLSGAAWVFTDPGTPAQSEVELLPSVAATNMLF